MPIITKPAIEKGTPASITLDKAALAALPIVSADGYFSDSANWARVRIFYTAPGKQKEVLNFDATQVTPQAQFSVSSRARNAFQVQKIVIIDFDNGSFEVPRSSLVTSEFDVSFSSLLATCALGLGTVSTMFSIGGPLSPSLGQSFTLAQPATVSSIRLYTSKVDGLTGFLSLNLIAGENLSGTILGTSQAVNVSSIANAEGFTEFVFSSPVALSSGLNTFTIVNGINGGGSGSVTLLGYVATAPGLYASGRGSPFGAFNDSADYIFEVYGN